MTTRHAALVVDVGQPLGFVVDRVSSVVASMPAISKTWASIKTTVNTEMLSSLIKDVGGHAMIMVLDFAKVIEREFSQISAISRSTGVAGAAQASVQSEEEDSSDELQLVSFDVDGQEYAIAIEDVQEIVQVPEAIIHVPRSDSACSGRDDLAQPAPALVNRAAMFALPHRNLDEKSRIVVLTMGGVSVGVVVDAGSEVLRVSKSGVGRASPQCWLAKAHLPRSLSICRLDNGKRLVSIVTGAPSLRPFGHIKEALSAVSETEQEIEREFRNLDESLGRRRTSSHLSS